MRGERGGRPALSAQRLRGGPLAHASIDGGVHRGDDGGGGGALQARQSPRLSTPARPYHPLAQTSRSAAAAARRSDSRASSKRRSASAARQAP